MRRYLEMRQLGDARLVVQRTEALRNVFQLLVKLSTFVEPLSNRELTVDALLRDIKVLHVEEAIFPNALDQCLGKLLLAFRCAKKTKVDSDEIGPFEVLLWRK